MKQFNLQEYLAHPERKVVTRDGKKVRIICTDRAGLNTKPIVALITLPNGDEVIKTFWNNGFETTAIEGENDLFFAPEKHEGWVNILHCPNGNFISHTRIFKSEKDAEKVGKNFGSYIATIKIEWEE